MKPAKPFFVTAVNSLAWAGSIAVKLKHDLPCMRFRSDGDSPSRSGVFA